MTGVLMSPHLTSFGRFGMRRHCQVREIKNCPTFKWLLPCSTSEVRQALQTVNWSSWWFLYTTTKSPSHLPQLQQAVFILRSEEQRIQFKSSTPLRSQPLAYVYLDAEHCPFDNSLNACQVFRSPSLTLGCFKNQPFAVEYYLARSWPGHPTKRRWPTSMLIEITQLQLSCLPHSLLP